MKKIRTYLSAFLALIMACCLHSPLSAQNDNNFQLATQLMQQQKYAEALPLLKELHEKEENMYLYADRLMDCLIQLKKYEEGFTIARKYTDTPNFRSRAMIRLAELHHFNGEEQKALEIWKRNVEENSNNLQIYINTARTMVDRREYLEAVDVYKSGRMAFQNASLFFSDIANAYMRAGEYELAIEEWIHLLENAPNQLPFIQRSLMRYNDPLLYDITIVELNERLDNISITNPNYQNYYQLQIWLLQENKLYRRALATAKEYESRTSTLNYSLFNLGKQLTDNNQFELAEEAFTYYAERTYGEVRWRSLEELSNAYSKWAKFIDDYNLDFEQRKDSLFRMATTLLDSIVSETGQYSRMSEVHMKRAELSLDHVFNLQKAERALSSLSKLPQSERAPEIPYLEGRIHLAKKEYAQARISFTRANKIAEIGPMAEKTRYFLALTDFYAGDYEFATIQLKTLGRQNTSYYANDALELRLWLQDGTSADTTGENLSRFAQAVYMENNGQTHESAERFLELIRDPMITALKDDALLFVVRSRQIDDSTKLDQLMGYLNGYAQTPIHEKLLWEKAKLVEKIQRKGSDLDSLDHPSAREIYEQLILSYPQGFYAPYARERLSHLTNPTS